jgi:eukaryotic-like serine/threonine-protein kinase
VQQEQLILPVGNTIRDPHGHHYVIEDLLGRGGFGAVYLVRDRHDVQGVFALKEVIDPSTTDRDRFIYEANLLKRLSHKALPRVYDVFENEKLKRVYMRMDYVQGKDLEALLAEQPAQRFPLELILAVMTPVAQALEYLHRQVPPIVHRDIKPANIIEPMRGEEAVLVDFGLAKEYVEGKTTSVIRHGSPGYAALEQYGHGGTTPRTDIYGLGATLYTLLTGVVPADPVTRITESKGFDPLPPVSLVAPNISSSVARAIQRAMSINAEQRFQSVEEFWRELTASATRPAKSATSDDTLKTPKMLLQAPKPLSVTEQQLPQVTSTPLRASRSHDPTPFMRRPGRLLGSLLGLCILVALGASIFLFQARHTTGAVPAARPTPRIVTTSPFTSTPAATATPANQGAYPSLYSSYSGTVSDLLAKDNTAMFLTNIQQRQGSLRGDFQGLGLVGPFNGTVSTGGKMHFRASVQGGNSQLDFTGNIKVGGDLVGSYVLLDKNGEQLGDSGLWSVARSS